MSNEHGHDDIGCMEAINTLYAYLDGELGEGVSIDQIEAHLRHCESCFSRAEIEAALTDHIRRLERRATPAGVRSRLGKLLDEL